METKIWTRDEIDSMLDKSQKAVEKAVVAIYNLQTADEKTVRETKHKNNIGFASCHANFLTWAAEVIIAETAKGKALGTVFYSPSKVAKMRKFIKNYSGQLVRIANGENLVA